MSVIFKEKHYDHLSILLKNTAAVITILIILLTGFNLFYKNKIEVLSRSLEKLRQEELKHQVLIEKFNNEKGKNEANKYSNLLIKITQYSAKITFNSIQIKNDKINLNAVSSNQKNIFKLIENLKTDENFSEVKLVNINYRNNYYFQLELRNNK